METLEARRLKSRLNMAYKIINGHIILGPNMLPKSANNGKQRKCNDTNVGFDNQLIEPVPNLQTSGKTFFYSIPKIWNQHVSASQAKAPSVDAFKRYFRSKV